MARRGVHLLAVFAVVVTGYTFGSGSPVSAEPGTKAERGDRSSQYYVTINRACGEADPRCGNLSIFRERTGSGSKVQVALYHRRCLGFRGSPYRYRWLVSPVVRTSGNRFHVKIDRPRLKLKLRGRFIGQPGTSSVKGTLSFRNLNRSCGFRAFGFRQRETSPTTDPQG